MGPDPHAVLSHGLEFDDTGVPQGRQIGAQALVQKIALLAAEIGEGVVVDLNPTTDPAVGVMGLRQTRQAPCAAHTVQGG